MNSITGFHCWMSTGGMGQEWATLLFTLSSTLQSRPTVSEHGITHLEDNCDSHNRGMINKLMRRFRISGVSRHVNGGTLVRVAFKPLGNGCLAWDVL